LMIASRSGSLAAVKLLLEKGAKVDAADSRKGQNALMWAAAEGHSDIVDLLIQSGANVKTASDGGFTALVFATQKGNANVVTNLIAAGADPNHTLPGGLSVLQVGVLAGKTPAAAVLMDHGANVNVADKTGTTPLHTAAQAGNLELVTKLLEKQADPNARTARIAPGAAAAAGGGGALFRSGGEQTPLLLAARANKASVMRALVAAGADPKLKTQDGSTLLMAAANSGHVEAVKYAYELAPDINAVNSQKSTVIHQAVTGSLQNSTQPEVCKVIQFLADKGAALDELDGRGRTPITIANVLPIDNAVDLLAKLIEASGKTPKQSPKR
jgi:ankyrin repeat protein